MQNKERTRVSIQIPDELLSMIDQKCAYTGTPRSQFILSCLAAVFDTEKIIKDALPELEQKLMDMVEEKSR